MKALKLMLLLALVCLGLMSRGKTTHHSHSRSHESVAPTEAVNRELLNNAERLTETLRKCKQTKDLQ